MFGNKHRPSELPIPRHKAAAATPRSSVSPGSPHTQVHTMHARTLAHSLSPTHTHTYKFTLCPHRPSHCPIYPHRRSHDHIYTLIQTRSHARTLSLSHTHTASLSTAVFKSSLGHCQCCEGGDSHPWSLTLMRGSRALWTLSPQSSTWLAGSEVTGWEEMSSP